jgi:hypothetical protein
MPSKKRVRLQQFGIIHLPNPDLTYIRNLRKKQNYVATLPPLENLNQESWEKIKLFYTLPPLLIRVDAPRITPAWSRFSQLGINDNLRWGTIGEIFFCFCRKITIATWDGELLELLLALENPNIYNRIIESKRQTNQVIWLDNRIRCTSHTYSNLAWLSKSPIRSFENRD